MQDWGEVSQHDPSQEVDNIIEVVKYHKDSEEKETQFLRNIVAKIGLTRNPKGSDIRPHPKQVMTPKQEYHI